MFGAPAMDAVGMATDGIFTVMAGSAAEFGDEAVPKQYDAAVGDMGAAELFCACRR